MFLRQFGFEKDDERFFRGALDPITRPSLLIELQAHRKRSMTGSYVMLIVGVLYGLIGLVSAKPPHLLGSAFFLFWGMMLLVFSFHADAKYKLLKVVETMEQGKNGEVA